MGLGAEKIRVLVVDDSLLMRSTLNKIISSDPSMEVIGSSANGKDALEKIILLKPDVMTLDVEMPIMDGITLLKNIPAIHKPGIIMISSLTSEGGEKTLEALEHGAFDAILKPQAQESQALERVAVEIKYKLHAAYEHHTLKLRQKSLKTTLPSTNHVSEASHTVAKKLDPLVAVSDTLPVALQHMMQKSHFFAAIGISTGGPPCLTQIVQNLKETTVPVLIVQHMLKGFSAAMAKRFNTLSKATVVEAENGQKIQTGFVYIAPGDLQMGVDHRVDGIYLKIAQEEPVSGHRPSVDYLFSSIQTNGIRNMLATLMTGMGNDGAKGLLSLKNAGAWTVAQDAESSTVYGMPKVAAELGAAQQIMSLPQIVKLYSLLG